MRWSADEASPGSTSFLHTVTDLGSTPAVVILSLAVATATVRKRADLAVVGFLVITVGGQFALVNVIKWIVDRARPDIGPLSGFAGPSFPSGMPRRQPRATPASPCFSGSGDPVP